jgi:hypothetical protein
MTDRLQGGADKLVQLRNGDRWLAVPTSQETKDAFGNMFSQPPLYVAGLNRRSSQASTQPFAADYLNGSIVQSQDGQ